MNHYKTPKFKSRDQRVTQKERDDKEAEKSKKVSENLQNLITGREKVEPEVDQIETGKEHEEPGNVFDDAFKYEQVNVPKGIIFNMSHPMSH